MTTCFDIILLPSRAAGAATASRGHHQGEHDGEALEVVQLNEMYASTINSSICCIAEHILQISVYLLPCSWQFDTVFLIPNT